MLSYMPVDRRTRPVFHSCLNRSTVFRWRQPRETDLDWRAAPPFRLGGESHLESPKRKADRRELDNRKPCPARVRTEPTSTSDSGLHGEGFRSAPGSTPRNICQQDVASL